MLLSARDKLCSAVLVLVPACLREQGGPEGCLVEGQIDSSVLALPQVLRQHGPRVADVSCIPVPLRAHVKHDCMLSMGCRLTLCTQVLRDEGSGRRGREGVEMVSGGSQGSAGDED